MSDKDKLAAELLHHYGQSLSPGDPVVPGIFPSAVFHLPGDPSNVAFQYGRYHNPTWAALEAALALLEGAGVVSFPSGMAAIAAVLFANVSAGERILLPSDGYFTTRLLGEKYLKALGVHVETRATADFLTGGFEGYRLVLIETPSNPGLDVCDIAAAALLAKHAGALLAVDNTTMTPLGQRPLALGADVVICSDTKMINGHSDVLMGHVAARDDVVLARVLEWRKFAGAIPSPFDAFLVHRGLETLEVRFSRMCATAALIAPRLVSHKSVKAVRFPGLAGDPSHDIARRQMSSFGSMISLTLNDGRAADAFIERCSFIQPSTSFGGVRSCAERRARWGDNVADGFVRLSIGLEPAEVLWAAMDAALDA